MRIHDLFEHSDFGSYINDMESNLRMDEIEWARYQENPAPYLEDLVLDFGNWPKSVGPVDVVAVARYLVSKYVGKRYYPRFGETEGRPFSLVASAVYQELRATAEEEAFAGMVGAPSECSALIWNGAKKHIQAILEYAGFTPEEFDREVADRTSDRWAYFSGMQVQGWFWN